MSLLECRRVIVFTEQTLQQPRVIVVCEEKLKRVYLQWWFGDSRQVSTTSKSTGVWSAPRLMENRVRRVYPRWEFITAPPTRRSPLAEGRTGLPNPCVAIEHHWFALLYCISFSSLHSCSVPIVVSDLSQFIICQSVIHIIYYHHWLICFVSIVHLWFHSCYIHSLLLILVHISRSYIL